MQQHLEPPLPFHRRITYQSSGLPAPTWEFLLHGMFRSDFLANPSVHSPVQPVTLVSGGYAGSAANNHYPRHFAEIFSKRLFISVAANKYNAEFFAGGRDFLVHFSVFLHVVSREGIKPSSAARRAHCCTQRTELSLGWSMPQHALVPVGSPWTMLASLHEGGPPARSLNASDRRQQQGGGTWYALVPRL